MNDLTVAAIYGGIGSAMFGPKYTGFTPLFNIEPRSSYLNKETWDFNWPGVPTSTKLNDFRSTHAMLLVGQPSCKNYSLLNRTATRDSLYRINPDDVEYVRFLKQVERREPDFFILENLPRIRDFLFFPEGDNEFYAATELSGGKIINVIKVISLPGYKILQFDLNSADFGIPQLRRRLFVVGYKKEYELQITLPQEPHKTVRDVIGDLGRPSNISEEPRIPNHVTSELTNRQLSLVMQTDSGEKNKAKEFKLVWDRPAPTFVGSSIKPIHPYFHRHISPREAMRIMGYRDEVVLFGSYNHMYDQAGRSICPPINEFFSAQIKRAVEKLSALSELNKIFSFS